MKLAHLFEIHGLYAAKNPCMMVIIASTIAIIANLGLLNIVVEVSCFYLLILSHSAPLQLPLEFS